MSKSKIDLAILIIKELKVHLAILMIGGLTAYSLFLGINGVRLALGLAMISGLGGYEVKAFADWVRSFQKDET